METHPPPTPALQTPRFPSSVAVVIPAWQPPRRLIPLVRSLADLGCNAILLIDDGSGPRYDAIFHHLSGIPAITLLRHAQNTGKGHALKTGLRHFSSAFPHYKGVVSADADGQHSPEDIARVAAALAQQPGRLILGVRPPTPAMPFRSRLGNFLTRYAFRAATGVMLQDTQTGLRGFPKALLPQLLAIPGQRYEYEMAVLLHSCRSGCAPFELPIRTLYPARNASSHFRPVRDSVRIYRVLAQSILPLRTAQNSGLPATLSGKS